MKKLICLIGVLLLFSAPAFAGEESEKVHIKVFSIDERTAKTLIVATKYWEKNEDVEFELFKHKDIKPDAVIVFVDEVNHCGAKTSDKIAGCAQKKDARKSSQVLIAKVQKHKNSKVQIFRTVHEIGHLLGKGHTEDKKSPMYTPELKK